MDILKRICTGNMEETVRVEKSFLNEDQTN